jgi:hypothetical protein
MTKVMLQVNFDLDFSKNEPIDKTLERARKFADVPGLIWKIWLRDENSGRGGGLYLFEDRSSAEAWAKGRFETMTQRMPWSANVTFEYFDVDEELSTITGGLPQPVAARPRSVRARRG